MAKAIKVSAGNGFYLIKSIDDILRYRFVSPVEDDNFWREWFFRVEAFQENNNLNDISSDYQYLKDADEEDDEFRSRTRWWGKKDAVIGWFEEKEASETRPRACRNERG